MSERMRRPTKPVDEENPEPDGPRRPKVERPDTSKLLKRMGQVDPQKARRYANPQNIGQ